VEAYKKYGRFQIGFGHFQNEFQFAKIWTAPVGRQVFKQQYFANAEQSALPNSSRIFLFALFILSM
jgi:hypothetical protein